MAEDAVVKDSPVNSCCATWKERYSKLQQRNTKLEDARTALRQCIEIFERQVAKMQTENLDLKKAYEEERVRADKEREEKVKESAMRVTFENEICSLKSEILSLQQKGGSGTKDVDEEVTLLRARISEGETEINRLKDLLEKERMRPDFEKKKAEAEMKKDNEVWKKVRKEKSRADEEREEKLKESMRVSLENEISALKSEIFSSQKKGGSGARDVDEAVTLKARVSEAETEIDWLKKLLEKERMRADSEKKKAEAEKKKAEAALRTVKAEKGKADEERRVAGIEGKKAEEDRLQLERLKVEVQEARSKLVLETLKSKESNKKHEAERQKMIKEKKRADSEMAKAEEQRKLAEMNRKKAIEEKNCADKLSQQLEEGRRSIEKLQKEIDELVSSKKLIEAPADLCVKQMNAETAKLRGELRLEMLKRDSDESKLGLDCVKSEEANKRLKEGKHKANREKKRADLDMRKVKELRKVADMFREKAKEEKNGADQLAHQLEDNGRRNEELPKEILELVHSRTLVEPSVVPLEKNVNGETAGMKLLRKQLKLEKMQAKHAKRVSKLEKGLNNLLQQEQCRLNQEFVQFSHRLNILDYCLSRNDVGRHDLAKTCNFSNIQSLNLKNKLLGIEPYYMHLHSGNELLKPNCTGMDAPDRFRQSIECSEPMLPTSGGNFTESISGIDSKLDPLLRGSNRKMLQSSAINSSMASFSDRRLVGSQERGVISITKSAQLAEEKSIPQPKFSMLSSADTKTRCNENIAVVAENSVRSPLRNDAVGRRSGHSKKRKRILDAVESIENLSPEGNKLHLQQSEKLSNLSMMYDMFGSQMDKPLKEGRCLVTSLQDNLYSKQDKYQKKKKAFLAKEVAMTHLSNSNGRKDGLETKGIDEANVHLAASTPVNNLTGTTQTCKDGIGDSGRSNSGSFEEVEDGDYMKLLDLDSTVDEDRYRVAIEMPLSPSLPEIEFQSSDTFELDNSKRSVVGCIHEEFSNANDYMVPCCSFDVMNVEIESNKLELNSIGTTHVPLLHKKEAIHAGNACVSQICDSGAELWMSDSVDDGPKISCESNPSLGGLPQYCVVFSDTHDSSSVSKVFCATRTCMAQCSMISQTDWVVQKTLFALLEVEDLLPKEKVCVFFSLLLQNFFGIALENFRNLLDRDVTYFLDSFAGHMRTVISDVETRSMFAELCNLDELLALIEDFLIDRRVLVHSDASSEPLLGFDPRVKIALNGGEIILSFQKASTHQLVAGGIVLASLCAAFDHIGFICEASYNMFRMQKIDPPMLTILHVFAYICGSKYFTLNDYSLIMTLMKALITFLERANLSVNPALSLPSLTDVRPEFMSCTKCPFSEGAVSMDVVVSLLLEKLQNCGLSDILHEDLMESVKLLNYESLSHNEENKPSSSHGECLHKFGKPTSQSKTVFDGTLCHLGDVLSLVELVACNMSWDWTCNHIVNQLLKMLESCVLENLLAAIVILLGQVGRLGVDARGYKDTAVENLRGRLSTFLCQITLTKKGLPIQIATATALLGVIPLNFEELIKSNLELPAVLSCSIPPADCIRKWFSLLSNEQQSLSFRLLTAVMTSCRTG